MSNDFLASTGTSLKFENVGDIHKGTLLKITPREDKDPNGTIKTWADGSPKMVYLWELKLEDGSEGTMWVRGNLVKVLKEAAKAAGATCANDLVGADVTVKHHALGESTTKGFAKPKLFQAKIKLNKQALPPDADDPFAEE
jgi:hypothetical protein